MALYRLFAVAQDPAGSSLYVFHYSIDIQGLHALAVVVPVGDRQHGATRRTR